MTCFNSSKIAQGKTKSDVFSRFSPDSLWILSRLFLGLIYFLDSISVVSGFSPDSSCSLRGLFLDSQLILVLLSLDSHLIVCVFYVDHL